MMKESFFLVFHSWKRLYFESIRDTVINNICNKLKLMMQDSYELNNCQNPRYLMKSILIDVKTKKFAANALIAAPHNKLPKYLVNFNIIDFGQSEAIIVNINQKPINP